MFIIELPNGDSSASIEYEHVIHYERGQPNRHQNVIKHYYAIA